MVMIGGPATNDVAMWLAECAENRRAGRHCGLGAVTFPPVTFATNGYQLGPCFFHDSSPGLGLAFVTPLPSPSGLNAAARLGLVLDATTPQAFRQLVRFSFSSSQALTRAAFSNLWPDYLIAGPEFATQGYGGVYAAGYWGPTWGYDARSGFVEWCGRAPNVTAVQTTSSSQSQEGDKQDL